MDKSKSSDPSMKKILELLVEQKAGIEKLITVVKSTMAASTDHQVSNAVKFLANLELSPSNPQDALSAEGKGKRVRKRKKNIKTTVPYDSTHNYLRVIIRGLPPMDTYELERHLKLSGYPVISAYCMHLGPEKTLSRFVLVYLEDNESGNEIYDLRQVSCFPVKVERPYAKSVKNDRCYSRNALDGRIEVIGEDGFQRFFHFNSAPEWKHMEDIYSSRF